jgi:transposase
MGGQAVIAAYHDLWQVEKSFRMAKSDLRARPIFHRHRDAIEAHLTVVFAALAISRHLQDATDVSIKKIVRALRPLQTRDHRNRRPHLHRRTNPHHRSSRNPQRATTG